MLKRKVMQKLIDWQERRHGMCTVLPEGDRRVGKIALVKAFGEGRYDSFLLVDCFELPAEVRRIFEDHADDLDTFFMMLATYYGTRLRRRHSLVVFDVAGFYPKAHEISTGRVSRNDVVSSLTSDPSNGGTGGRQVMR